MPSPAEAPATGHAVTVLRTPAVHGLRLELGGPALVLRHDLTAADIDNDLAGRLATAMAVTGLTDSCMFEQLFAGVVESTVDDPVRAWSAFYRNTLTRLGSQDPGTGSIGEFAPIYGRASSLARGHRVLDLASCFGFLSILLAEDGLDVVACDLSVGSMRLLSTVDDRIRCLCCRAEELPLCNGAVDTVLALHLLEHVDEAAGFRIVGEAVRVARQRVVIAVPYEDEPTAAYGHVRTLNHDVLEALGRQSGLRYDVIDRDGGWLILDH